MATFVHIGRLSGPSNNQRQPDELNNKTSFQSVLEVNHTLEACHEMCNQIQPESYLPHEIVVKSLMNKTTIRQRKYSDQEFQILSGKPPVTKIICKHVLIN